MNPHKAKKVDINSLSPDEQRLFRLYGKLPSRSDHFAKHLKDRKYFDSGDYAMSKAGKGDGVDTGSVGSQHPVPENIPHLLSPANGGNGLLPPHLNHPMQAGSPVKESSFLNRETTAEEVEGAATDPNKKKQVGDGSGGNAADNAAGSDTATPTAAPTATPAATAAAPAAGGDAATASAATAPSPPGPNKTGQDAIPIRR